MSLVRFGSSYSMLVLRKFQVNRDPGAETAVEISGRAPGLLAWLLTLLKLQPEVYLRMTQTELSFRSAGIGGVSHSYIPTRNIASTACGYRRLGVLLFFAALCALWGMASLLGSMAMLVLPGRNDTAFLAGLGALLLWLLVGAFFLFLYNWWRRIVVTIETVGGSHFGLIFKRSVLENVSVDMPQALEAIEVINARVLQTRGGKRPSSETPADSVAGACPQCTALNPSGSRFCESCGTAMVA